MTYHFLRGLPRTGATLLSSILNQNPDIHSGPESPVCGLLDNTFRFLAKNEQLVLYPKHTFESKLAVSTADSYYFDTDAKYIIDKCRVWSHKDNRIIAKSLNSNPKIICPVRDILEILTSWITLIESTDKLSFVDRGLQFMGKEINNDNRCDWLMKEDGLLKLSYESLKTSYKDPEVMLVEYDDLIDKPVNTMYNVYDFLGIPPHKHDFNNIVNDYLPHDGMLGLENLHVVKKTLSKTSKDPKDVLSDYVIKKYSNMEFWK